MTITSGPPLPELAALELASLHEHDSYLFLRYELRA